MRGLELARPGESLSVLCLGAHSDDIEIGAGGTILSLIAKGVRLRVHWCVLSATGRRATEAEYSARSFLDGASLESLELCTFSDGLFPSQGREIKLWFEDLKSRVNPDVIFTHRPGDAHQDHREVARLTTTSFRDHLILAYEIPKWDGDLGPMNAYVPITESILHAKIELLVSCFGTQRAKDWFDADVFRGMARIRGAECRAPERYAEAYEIRKATLL